MHNLPNGISVKKEWVVFNFCTYVPEQERFISQVPSIWDWGDRQNCNTNWSWKARPHSSYCPNRPTLNSIFHRIKQLGVFLSPLPSPPPLDGVFVQCWVSPNVWFSVPHLYTWSKRHLSKNTTPTVHYTNGYAIAPPIYGMENMATILESKWQSESVCSAFLLYGIVRLDETPLPKENETRVQWTTAISFAYIFALINIKPLWTLTI